MTRLKCDSESLGINSSECGSTFHEQLQVLRHTLQPDWPLSEEVFRESYQFKLERDRESSKAVIEKLASQPTAVLKDCMEHVPRVDAMLNSNMKLTQVPFHKMRDKEREGGGGGSNDDSSFTCGDVGHPARKCPYMEKFLATWKENIAAANNSTDKKETD